MFNLNSQSNTHLHALPLRVPAPKLCNRVSKRVTMASPYLQFYNCETMPSSHTKHDTLLVYLTIWSVCPGTWQMGAVVQVAQVVGWEPAPCGGKTERASRIDPSVCSSTVTSVHAKICVWLHLSLCKTWRRTVATALTLFTKLWYTRLEWSVQLLTCV